MACQEHMCGSCDEHWFDNTIYRSCPHCGSPSVTNWFDEREKSYERETEQEEEESDDECE